MGEVLMVKKVNNIATETEQRPKGPTTFPSPTQLFSYGELPFVANKEAPSTQFLPSPKPGFPSPPDGVFYCYLLEFCPPASVQVLRL